MRRKLVSTETMSAETGERVVRGQRWVTEPCGHPLWTDRDRSRGVCQSCTDGWRDPHNFPVTGDAEAARTSVAELAREIGYGFHPDTLAEDYRTPNGKRSFNPMQCVRINTVLAWAFETIGDEVYDVGMQTFQQMRAAEAAAD